MPLWGERVPAPRYSPVAGVPPALKSVPVERVPPAQKPTPAKCALSPVNHSSSNKSPGVSPECVPDEAVQRKTTPIGELAVRVCRVTAKVFRVMCCQFIALLFQCSDMRVVQVFRTE